VLQGGGEKEKRTERIRKGKGGRESKKRDIFSNKGIQKERGGVVIRVPEKGGTRSVEMRWIHRAHACNLKGGPGGRGVDARRKGCGGDEQEENHKGKVLEFGTKSKTSKNRHMV